MKVLCSALLSLQEYLQSYSVLSCSLPSLPLHVFAASPILPSLLFSLLFLSFLSCHLFVFHAIVSYGFHNKLPQTWWLKTTCTYSVIVLEIRSLKAVSWAGIKVLNFRAVLRLEALHSYGFSISFLAFCGLRAPPFKVSGGASSSLC